MHCIHEYTIIFTSPIVAFVNEKIHDYHRTEQYLLQFTPVSGSAAKDGAVTGTVPFPPKTDIPETEPHPPASEGVSDFTIASPQDIPEPPASEGVDNFATTSLDNFAITSLQDGPVSPASEGVVTPNTANPVDVCDTCLALHTETKGQLPRKMLPEVYSQEFTPSPPYRDQFPDARPAIYLQRRRTARKFATSSDPVAWQTVT